MSYFFLLFIKGMVCKRHLLISTPLKCLKNNVYWILFQSFGSLPNGTPLEERRTAEGYRVGNFTFFTIMAALNVRPSVLYPAPIGVNEKNCVRMDYFYFKVIIALSSQKTVTHRESVFLYMH
jgi:hypothetical protein